MVIIVIISCEEIVEVGPVVQGALGSVTKDVDRWIEN